MGKNLNPAANTKALAGELVETLEAEANQADLQKELSEKNSTIEDLQSQISLLKSDNASLEAVNNDLTATVEELSKALESKKTIHDAARELAEKKVPAVPAPFELDGRKYRFISPVFVFRKQRIIAAEAVNNAELLATLVDAKIGALVEL